MGAKDLRDRVEQALLSGMRRWIFRLPHGRVRERGRRLGRLSFRLAPVHRSRKLALDNLRLALPELDPKQRLEVARRCFEHYGGYLFETVSLERFGPEEVLELFDVEGREHIEWAEARGSGYFLMTGHWGCWEAASQWLAADVGPSFLVARPLDNPLLDRDLRAARERLGNQVIDKKGAALRALSAVQRGGRVAILIDQRVRESLGILVPFFGEPAWTSPLLAKLSKHTGAPVVPVYCEPAAEGRYQVCIREPILPMDLPPGPDEAACILTRRYLDSIEAEVWRRPELYLWPHNRWKK